ncbi:MAG TPA: DUF3108 domain-containing protein [Dehalococcoidia bacterium]
MSNRRTGYALALLAVLVALLGAACNSQPSLRGTEDVPIRDIPWSDGEETHYALRNDDGERIGSGTLRIERDGETYRLTQSYQAHTEANRSPTDTDEMVSVVQAADLKPVRFERRANNDDELYQVEAEFAGDQVLATFTRGNRSQDRETSLPEQAYDNESLVFLWRAMPLEDEFSARIVAIAFDVVGRSILKPVATLRVVQQERVEVPAGAFNTWRVEALTGGRTVTAWIGVEAPHYLVKYDSGRNVVYELERVGQGR